ncbi:MAG: cytochrome c [Myxococcota bacterium]
MYRLLALTLLLAPAALSAPPTPAASVKYRHAVMEALGGHMAATAMIVKGESDRSQDLVMHATALHDLSTSIASLFPDGTGPGAPGIETDAKAEIWTKKTEFAAAAKKLETESAKLLEAAKKNDPVSLKAALGATGGACGDCHDAFKVDEDKH